MALKEQDSGQGCLQVVKKSLLQCNWRPVWYAPKNEMELQFHCNSSHLDVFDHALWMLLILRIVNLSIFVWVWLIQLTSFSHRRWRRQRTFQGNQKEPYPSHGNPIPIVFRFSVNCSHSQHTFLDMKTRNKISPQSTNLKDKHVYPAVASIHPFSNQGITTVPLHLHAQILPASKNLLYLGLTWYILQAHAINAGQANFDWMSYVSLWFLLLGLPRTLKYSTKISMSVYTK